MTFRTGQELKEKVDYYLAHPEKRLQIATRACIRSHRDHTYEIRLAKMFELLALSPRSPASAPETILTHVS